MQKARVSKNPNIGKARESKNQQMRKARESKDPHMGKVRETIFINKYDDLLRRDEKKK